MPVPVVVVAPMVPVSGAKVGRPGRWIYPRTVFRPPAARLLGFHAGRWCLADADHHLKGDHLPALPGPIPIRRGPRWPAEPGSGAAGYDRAVAGNSEGSNHSATITVIEARYENGPATGHSPLSFPP
jgi:hypothetical protein